MKKEASYFSRRMRWTIDSTLNLLGASPDRRWRLTVTPVASGALGTAAHAVTLLISSSASPDWILLIERWALWVAYIAVPTVGPGLFYWAQSASYLDREKQDEISCLRSQLSEFKRRLRPDIWITPKVQKDMIKGLDNSWTHYRAGFSVENRSDCDLVSVRIDFLLLDQWCEFNKGPGSFLPYTVFNLPIALEWSPQEQDSSGVQETKIPAGSSCWIGLFEIDPNSGGQSYFMLSANHGVRGSLMLLPDRYRFKIRLSAEGIPAIESAYYETETWGACEITPDAPAQLLNPRAEIVTA